MMDRVTSAGERQIAPVRQAHRSSSPVPSRPATGRKGGAFDRRLGDSGWNGSVDICFVLKRLDPNKIKSLVRCTADLGQELDGVGLDWRPSPFLLGDLIVAGDRIGTDLPFVTNRRRLRPSSWHAPAFRRRERRGIDSEHPQGP
jgi:hypothetical protein